MLDWIKNKIAGQTAAATPAIPELLGLRIGGSVELNDLKLRLLEGKVTFADVAKIQLIQAVGVIHLDESSTILRYYTDDDGFFQFLLTGGTEEQHIQDGKLWFYYDTLSIDSELEWNRQLEHGISQPSYTLGEQTFQRAWHDTGTKNMPVAMTETTFLENGKSSSTDQFLMLYERDTGADILEYLMIAGEEKIINDSADRCLVQSTGIDLSQADFTVIS